MNGRPTPHQNSLKALAVNPKLPHRDKVKVEEAADRYDTWVNAISALKSKGNALLKDMVTLTNEYKKFVEFNLIFKSEDDFLYRQAGQLKVNNTILEEFLPYLVDERLVPGVKHVAGITVGPNPCYAGMFIGPIHTPLSEGGIYIKTKN